MFVYTDGSVQGKDSGFAGNILKMEFHMCRNVI